MGAGYGDLKVADGSRVRLRGSEAAILIDGNVGDERVRSRAYEGPALARRLERVCGRCEDKAVRSDAWPEAKLRGVASRKRGDGHEVSMLIRLGDGGREERAPSNISTVIIRPPQHGH